MEVLWGTSLVWGSHSIAGSLVLGVKGGPLFLVTWGPSLSRRCSPLGSPRGVWMACFGSQWTWVISLTHKIPFFCPKLGKGRGGLGGGFEFLNTLRTA